MEPWLRSIFVHGFIATIVGGLWIYAAGGQRNAALLEQSTPVSPETRQVKPVPATFDYLEISDLE